MKKVNYGEHRDETSSFKCFSHFLLCIVYTLFSYMTTNTPLKSTKKIYSFGDLEKNSFLKLRSLIKNVIV